MEQHVAPKRMGLRSLCAPDGHCRVRGGCRQGEGARRCVADELLEIIDRSKTIRGTVCCAPASGSEDAFEIDFVGVVDRVLT